ncbi:MAG TPA: glycosyltransferase N-terminal domain-containing protein [Luteibaculaceae bacterium]|nr:glycosyltransferase N-terminal domain-containing protein [Luteibaculaceae bacterium]
MRLAYQLALAAYEWLIRLAALRSEKARQWIAGRENWEFRLAQAAAQRAERQPLAWFHCASLGEYEQALPVIEQLRTKHPNYQVWVTFFSPSGMLNFKPTPLVDYADYLPLDLPQRAKRFLDITQPSVCYFVKYEIWHHYIALISQRQIPLYLISAVFKPSHIYFKPWGAWFKKSLQRFTHIFVQDQGSLNVLHANGIEHASISGDTRIDRVLQNFTENKLLPLVEQFLGPKKALVFGSAWEPEIEWAAKWIASHPEIPVILAPHEVRPDFIRKVVERLGENHCTLLSTGNPDPHKPVLIIDSVGQLKHIYRYAKYAVVGGGFGSGLHNILEPAVFGIPIFFGPQYAGFHEAVELVDKKAAFSIDRYESLEEAIDRFERNPMLLKIVSDVQKWYVNANTGASAKILAAQPQ